MSSLAQPPIPPEPAFTLDGEDFLSEEALAQMLGKKPRTIKQYRFKRKGPPWTQIGQRILYRKSAIMTWLLAQEVAPKKPTRQFFTPPPERVRRAARTAARRRKAKAAR